MADNPENSEAPEAPAAPRPAAPVKKIRNKVLTILLVILLIPVVIITLWIWVSLGYTYAMGERAGYVQKISKKGWICKTWEGELAMVNLPGAAQERFPFTIRSDSLAAVLTKMMGSRVSITYQQHKGVPTSCFGETEYYVVGVEKAAP